MSLQLLHDNLGWPSPDNLLRPGVGAHAVLAKSADQKLGNELRRFLAQRDPLNSVRVGILGTDVTNTGSGFATAIVCDFARAVDLDGLAEAHRLAWNFCRAPLLITVEPTLVRCWTCCEAPAPPGASEPHGEIQDLRLRLTTPISAQEHVASLLSWPALLAGDILRQIPGRFGRRGCADDTLLRNLRFVRQQLTDTELSVDIAHDLLARLIFVQFLWDRKDDQGQSALNPRLLARLHEQGELRSLHPDLSSLFRNKHDTYRLFRVLDNQFNGDLFPTGEDDSPEERERHWKAEMVQVEQTHLHIIADFVGGTLDMPREQHVLWRSYSFDVIPLDFISTIYEEFVRHRDDVREARAAIAAHYTPPHLVDLVLDAVLPWEGVEWNLRVLDPACGSGAFLVNVFRRLIWRWRCAHPGLDPKAEDLRSLLENNVFGVDLDPHAVRVASFSLYLAMCDEIDPKHYWRQVRFPALRGRTIRLADFFQEDIDQIRTLGNRPSFDVIVGNPPWGHASVTTHATRWGRHNGWTPANRNVGPLFLAKSIRLLQPNGCLAMVQPAELLYSTTRPFARLRHKVFSTIPVLEVVNLSTLRFGTFKDAVGPACVVVATGGEPGLFGLTYTVPKPIRSPEDDFRIVIGPSDTHMITRAELDDALVWTALVWGSKRDYEFVKRLRKLPTLRAIVGAAGIRRRRGIVTGEPHRQDTNIVGRPFLSAKDFPEGERPLILNPRQLPIKEDANVYARDSTDYRAFEPTQVLIKLGWRIRAPRFAARLVTRDARLRGVISTRSYYSISFPERLQPVASRVCVTLNSLFAAYYLLMTSGRFAMYRPEPSTEDFLDVPVPPMPEVNAAAVEDLEEVDALVATSLGLKPAERLLIEDSCELVLGALKNPRNLERAIGRPTKSALLQYAGRFKAVLHAGFGSEATVSARIYVPEAAGPAVVVAVFRLNGPDQQVVVEPVTQEQLLKQLHRLAAIVSPHDPPGVLYERSIRHYHAVSRDSAEVEVLVVKPAQMRHWSRSAAMADADAVAADIFIADVAAGSLREEAVA